MQPIHVPEHWPSSYRRCMRTFFFLHETERWGLWPADNITLSSVLVSFGYYLTIFFYLTFFCPDFWLFKIHLRGVFDNKSILSLNYCLYRVSSVFHIHVGFLQDPWFPPTSQKQASRWISYDKLSHKCVWMCVLWLWWKLVPPSVYHQWI